MRTVASVPVPTTAPVRFDLGGTFDVGGIIFYNASPNTLTVATLDGQQATCPANYWVKIVPSATHIFDGALLVTAQTQIASTALSAIMWADVYMPGEPMPAGDSGPLPNQMTAGNQQPRIQTVPYSSFQNNFSSQSISSGQADLTTIVASFPYSASTAGSAGFWIYWLLITGVNGSAAASELWSLTTTMRVVTLTAAQAVVQSANIFFAQLNAVGPVLTPIPLSFPNPLARYFTAGAGETTLALQTVLHISVLAAARAVSISFTFGFDNDVTNNNPPPGPGGGLESFSGQVIGKQYTGVVW